MDIKYHPHPATLMTCAAGSQPEALCAVVSSHLSMCEECMRDVERMEQIGVALLAQLDTVPTNAPAAHQSNGGRFSQSKMGPAGTVTSSDVPPPLRNVVGTELNGIAWKTSEPGIQTYVVPMSPGAEGELVLVKLDPGSSLRERAYEGEELLLVLRGSCTRKASIMQQGDYAEFFDQFAQSIVADSNDGCTLLIAYERLPH